MYFNSHHVTIDKTERSKRFSVIQPCKNREKNLLQSINSYIKTDMVDDIVIVDFNSKNNVRNFLKSNIDEAYFYKLNIIEVTTPTPYIASWSTNIGLYYCKNDTILKLDTDNVIVDSNQFFNKYSSYNLETHFIHFDWRNAITDEERYLNGLIIFSKKILINKGYINNKILFYGWEDCEVKNRHKESLIQVFIRSGEVIPIKNTDTNKIINQNYQKITFFGFNISEMNHIGLLNIYNQHISKIDEYEYITYEKDVVSLFNIENYTKNYSQISLNYDTITYYETNYNPLSQSTLSNCRNEVFELCLQCKNFLYYDNNVYTVMSLYIDILKKYEIFNTDEKILLFYLFCFNNKKTVSHKLTNILIISLYNEESITRCLELLFCLKKNVENEYISTIHILFENPENESFLYKLLRHLITIHDNWKTKIILKPIDSRPSYNDIFIYSNNNIIGNVIVANSDIVYDETLKHLFYLTEDDFVVLTRSQLYDGMFKLIHKVTMNNIINIFSEDTWIFMSPMKYSINCPILLGTCHCDGFLNYTLYKNKQYNVYNLYRSINSFHIQKGLSEGQLAHIDSNKQKKAWDKIINLSNNDSGDILYGVRLNTLYDFIYKTNYNNFVGCSIFFSHNNVIKEDIL